MAATITNEDVMKLRAQTGAGIMDCKNALKEADGNFEKAVEILRKKGLSGLAKRSGRAMKEGIVVLKNNGNKYVMLELNCETDFVGKNEEFVNLANQIADDMLRNDSFNPVEDPSAKEKLNNLAMKIGENMQIRRGVTYTKDLNTIIGSYLHGDNKKACLIKISYEGTPSDTSKIEELAKNLSMQAVAMGPKWTRREDVPAEVIEKEKEIYRSNPKNQGKSEAALLKMLEGRINKFYEETCLMEQSYIRDSKLNIKQYVDLVSKETGVNLKVEKFDTFIVGLE
ncbi:MAG: translation elongation factor Ts [Elusimicrobia bacterium]|nr:translation elongation factor Ts [Elusimicrobiota bacterium]